jgi:hypothetical protein
VRCVALARLASDVQTLDEELLCSIALRALIGKEKIGSRFIPGRRAQFRRNEQRQGIPDAGIYRTVKLRNSYWTIEVRNAAG